MESTPSPSEHAKRKLILAAISLFAEYGVESVSLRMINRKAGNKNNSALHYHFGSKSGLINAVVLFIQEHFDEIRNPLLDTLEHQAECDSISLRAVMEVFVLPYVVVMEQYDWGYAAVRTIARMEFDGNEESLRILSSSSGVSVKRLATLTRRALPHSPAKELKHRFNFYVNSTIRGFADYRNLHLSYLGNLSMPNLKKLGEFYMDMGERVLRGG